ncbi:capsular polysaccharide biosynthesis protein [Spirochaetia bacterium]|nr:capsular polysaccharide biosynthesis protein [Spirochaetia bacterium]
MKILLLANPNSSHTIKWAKSLSDSGINVFLFGFGSLMVNDYLNESNITILFSPLKMSEKEGALSKLLILGALVKLRKLIKKCQPDIIHAHYATSYGLIGALTGFHPFVLSVWGSDVYSFPQISFLHKMVLEYNLKKADKILSTSYVMANETKKYTNKPIEVTPFGIDLKQFFPQLAESPFNEGCLVIGTVKTLEEKYGIEYLIRAFKSVVDKYPELPLRLLVVGGGSLFVKFDTMIKELGIQEKAILTNKVPFGDVARYQNMLDVSVSVSTEDSESFGVAVLEAQACGKPVIVSNVGGLPEVVQDGVTGIIVPPADLDATAEAIERLVNDKTLREKMGSAGRERVEKYFNWDDNVKQMVDIYNKILDKSSKCIY